MMRLFQSQRFVVEIYDINVRLVQELYNRVFHNGNHELIWNSKSMGSGMYFMQVKANGKEEMRKLILISLLAGI